MAYVKILLLEDDVDDLTIITRILGESRLFKSQIKVTDKAQEFVSLLHTYEPDVILSDYRLPGFTGLEALRICLEETPEVPFIFVSGAIGEELAAETVLNGAWGFVLKSGLEKLNQVVNDNLVKSRQSKLPERVSSLHDISARIKRQIEVNNKTLEKARKIVIGVDDPSEDLKIEMRKKLENSQKNIQKLIDDLEKGVE